MIQLFFLKDLKDEKGQLQRGAKLMMDEMMTFILPQIPTSGIKYETEFSEKETEISFGILFMKHEN